MTVQLQYLFNDIPYTSLPAAKRRDIGRDMADLRRRIGRRTGQSDLLHGSIIGDIVPHVQHVLLFQTMLRSILLQNFRLIMNIEEDIVDPQIQQPLPDPLGIAAGNNQHPVPPFNRQLKRISVPRAHPPYLFARPEYLYAAIRHHTVHIEDKCPDRFEFFKYAHNGLIARKNS